MQSSMLASKQSTRRFRPWWLWISALALTNLLAASSGFALTIEVNDIGGAAPGTQVYQTFRQAADYWQSVFRNPVTVRIDLGHTALPASFVGLTNSQFRNYTAIAVEAAVTGNAQTTLAVAAAAHLPPLNGAGALNMITPGYLYNNPTGGIDARTRLYDNNNTQNNQRILATTANAKALDLLAPTTAADATIRFSDAANFDFNPRDGVTGIDFLGTALHEIGHALGFSSGVNGYDVFASPDGPRVADYGTKDPNDDTWGMVLDLYRYSANPTDLFSSDGSVHPSGPTLDWSIRNPLTDGSAFTQPYLSIDGGATALFGNLLSRGDNNGASGQAAHWRSALAIGQPYLGVMEPFVRDDAMDVVTALDIGAFNAIGWQTDIDPLLAPHYRATTAEIAATFAVEEPSILTVVLTIVGSLMVAGSRRRMAVLWHQWWPVGSV